MPKEFAVQLQHLRDLVEALPPSMQVGTPSNLLGGFGTSPTKLFPSLMGDDLWEQMDPIINRVIGYGTSPNEISKHLTIGRFGLMGVYNTFAILVQHCGVEAGLLEGKLEVISEAVKKRYLFPKCR